MINETATIFVDCPVEKAFNFISDARNRPKYDSGLIDVQQMPESPVQAGTRIIEVRRFLGRKLEALTEVSEFEPNRLYGLRILSGPIKGDGSYRFDPEGEGTRITWIFNMEPGGFFKLAEPIIAGSLKRKMEAALFDIKAVLENTP